MSGWPADADEAPHSAAVVYSMLKAHGGLIGAESKKNDRTMGLRDHRRYGFDGSHHSSCVLVRDRMLIENWMHMIFVPQHNAGEWFFEIDLNEFKAKLNDFKDFTYSGCRVRVVTSHTLKPRRGNPWTPSVRG